MRVYGIGLSKTGTTSLHHALKNLGFRSAHYPTDVLTPQFMLTRAVDNYEAICDLPAAFAYKQLDRKDPDAKFILTTRNVDDWLVSMKKHTQYRRFFKGTAMHAKNRMHIAMYGSLEFDKELYAQRFLDHHNRVREHFAGRPEKLLVVDLTTENGWQYICPFLKKPLCQKPFPHKKPGIVMHAMGSVYRLL